MMVSPPDADAIMVDEDVVFVLDMWDQLLFEVDLYIEEIEDKVLRSIEEVWRDVEDDDRFWFEAYV